MTIPFEIKRMDPLGQGVSLASSQEDSKVTFIPKTLPGEEGLAEVTEKKGKKVQFARVKEIHKQSPDRVESPCPHFHECQGCSFLHTSYEKEVVFKKDAYSFLFKNLISPEKVKYSQSKERLAYRNRIQLHYEQGKLGFRSKEGIHSVPECKLPHPLIQEKLKEIYQDEIINILPKDSPPKGHLEISHEEEGLQVYFNEPYSAGGFRQVNESMGLLAQQRIKEIAEKALSQGDGSNKLLIDLFGGSGFLSDFYQGEKLIIDRGDQRKENPQFIDLNLFSRFAAATLEKKINKLGLGEHQRVLIIDPPRSGLKNIGEFVQKTEVIIYLSCNPHSQVRDLNSLMKEKSWQLVELEFFDFFPATHHLESLAVLRRVKS